MTAPGRYPLHDNGRYTGALWVLSARPVPAPGVVVWGVPGAPTPTVELVYVVRHAGGRRTWEVGEAELARMLGS